MELYVNTADNSATGPGPCTHAELPFRSSITERRVVRVHLADNLDAADFSIIGTISDEDMAIVDSVYAGYGEVQEECDRPKPSVFCIPNGSGTGWAGINFAQYLAQGNDYIRQGYPKMDFVTGVKLLK